MRPKPISLILSVMATVLASTIMYVPEKEIIKS